MPPTASSRNSLRRHNFVAPPSRLGTLAGVEGPAVQPQPIEQFGTQVGAAPERSQDQDAVHPLVRRGAGPDRLDGVHG